MFDLDYIYYGAFSNNLRQGIGVMKKHSKEVYLGEWFQGRRNGWGKVFDSSGSLTFDGEFENGRFATPRFHAN